MTQGVPESGTKWGRLRGERHGVQCPAEAGVPAVKVVGELVVEDAGADLASATAETRHRDRQDPRSADRSLLAVNSRQDEHAEVGVPQRAGLPRILGTAR